MRVGSSNWQVQTHLKSPYATDFPEKYKVQLPRHQEEKGMRHFDKHLARTTKEQQPGGIAVPEHLSSGYLRPDRPTGRLPIEPAQHHNPKDGGIWEPVQRQYPKVPRVCFGNGVKIVDKPVNKDRPVDIWPATITVKDPFKPGGLRMFEGKRNTDVVSCTAGSACRLAGRPATRGRKQLSM